MFSRLAFNSGKLTQLVLVVLEGQICRPCRVQTANGCHSSSRDSCPPSCTAKLFGGLEVFPHIGRNARCLLTMHKTTLNPEREAIRPLETTLTALDHSFRSFQQLALFRDRCWPQRTDQVLLFGRKSPP